jgi:hypothetical protein
MATTITPISSTAASLGTTAPAAAVPTTVTAPVAGAQATTPNASVATTYSPDTAVVGGGGLSDFVGNAISKIATMAQNSMNKVQSQLTNEMTANGGNVEPARLQQINQQMSTYQMMMEMAAKIQDKQEQAAQVWLRQ